MKRVFAVSGDEVQFTCDGLYLKRPQDKDLFLIRIKNNLQAYTMMKIVQRYLML